MVKAILLTELFGAGAGMFQKGVRSVLGDGKVIKIFTPSEKAVLGEDIVNYIKSLRKGNRLKPLDKDNVYFNLFFRRGFKTIPSEWVLDISIPHGKHGHFGKTLSTAPSKYQGSLTVDGIKSAIKELRLSRKEEIAICKYSKNPTAANKKAALDLFPPELKENMEGILKSAVEQKRWQMFT